MRLPRDSAAGDNLPAASGSPITPIAVLAVAAVSGVAAATGSILFVGLIAAAVTAVVVVVFPKIHLIFGMIFALVATGVLEFFFSFSQANWLSSVIVLSMFLPVALSVLGQHRHEQEISCTAALLIVYVMSLVVSSVVNRIPIAQAAVGFRNYFPYIGVALLLMYGGFDILFVRKLIRILLYIAIAQIPVAIYQHLVSGPARLGIRGAIGRQDEAIVGTFGGSIVTGGYTGEMAAFLVMAIILTSALWRERRIKGVVAVIVSLGLLIPVLLAETKIALLLLPILAVIAFGFDLRKSPVASIVSIAGALGLVVAVAGVYAVKYWQSPGSAVSQLSYSFDPDFMVTPNHRGRVGTVVHWYQTNVEGGRYVATVLGHGAGSSLEASSTIGQGSAVRMYGVGLDSHGMSRLLWDGGILSLAVFSLLCVRTAYVASQLRKTERLDPEDRAGLTFALVAAVAMFVMLPYQMAVLGGSAMQFLFWFVIGYVGYMHRSLDREIPNMQSKIIS